MLAFILNLPLWGMFARFNWTLGTVQIPTRPPCSWLNQPFSPATRRHPVGQRRAQRLGCQRSKQKCIGLLEQNYIDDAVARLSRHYSFAFWRMGTYFPSIAGNCSSDIDD
jgi:hypothetical protein